MFKKGIAAIAASAVALLLASCSLLSQDAPRDENGQVTEATTISIFSLQKGDCFDTNSIGDGEVDNVKVIPCNEPHNAEVYAEKTLPDGAFPGDDALDLEIYDFCTAEYVNFVGIDWLESQYDIMPLTPTKGSWENEDDRVIQCIVDYGSETLSASVKGSAK